MRIGSLLLLLTLTIACGGGDSPPATTSSKSPAGAAPPGTPAAKAPASPTPRPTPGTAAEAGPRSTVDDEIPAEVRRSVGAEQERLLQAVRDGDPSVLEAVFERGRLPRTPREARAFFDPLRGQITVATVEPWHEFHAIPDGRQMTIDTDDGVRVVVPAAGPEVYVSLQQLRGGFRDGLLAAIWVLRDEGWRLHDLRLGAVRLGGKTAAEWYREAEALAAGGKPLPAWLRLTVADDLLDSVSFVGYAHADEARRLYARLGSELAAQHDFPLPLPSVGDYVEVVRIDPKFLQDGLSPFVHFATRRSLQDSSLGDEAQAVAGAVAALYPGFCEGTTQVALAAYNEIPSDPRKTYDAAAFIADCP